MGRSPRVRGKKDRKQPNPVHGVELKPIDYQPSKAELEADVRLPASIDRVVNSLFAGNRRNIGGKQAS